MGTFVAFFIVSVLQRRFPSTWAFKKIVKSLQKDKISSILLCPMKNCYRCRFRELLARR